jgi:hypothetical protein
MKKQPSARARHRSIVKLTTLAMFGAAGVMLWSIVERV